ncbi:MAG: HPF/RaiA family ribosome-associated protein [Burkholderiales bacterium]
MQVPMQITIRGMPHSDALDARIREKVAKLEEFHPRITSCRVTVEELRKHHREGKHFRVSVDIRLPGKEIVANREHDEDVYVALRDAFDHAVRQLEDAARELRGDVKTHAVPQHGTIARLFADEGYGFIETPDGRELYFSRENVLHPAFEQLTSGTEVQFLEELAAEGPQAKRISVGKHHGA